MPLTLFDLSKSLFFSFQRLLVFFSTSKTIPSSMATRKNTANPDPDSIRRQPVVRIHKHSASDCPPGKEAREITHGCRYHKSFQIKTSRHTYDRRTEDHHVKRPFTHPVQFKKRNIELSGTRRILQEHTTSTVKIS